MTPGEYIQLKAFARVDGAIMALLWGIAFACYIAGLLNPILLFIAIILVFVTPFVAAKRLQMFRDHALGGIISFRRGWAYVAMMFFYGSLLFALVQYGYFAYLDKGFLLHTMQSMMENADARQMMADYGMSTVMNESLAQMRAMRPIDMALNMFTTNLILGCILGFPIAVVIKKSQNNN